MAQDLVFPRLIYRGAPDTLGLGQHVGVDGTIVGETKRVDSQDALDADLAAGWRLTSALEAPKVELAAQKPTTKEPKK